MNRLALAVSLSALALGATACSEDVPDTRPAAETATDSPTDSPTEEPTGEGDSPTAEPSETSDPGTTVVPVYFVGDTARGPKLFREFRSVPSDNPLMEATALMLAGDSLDPDYRTLWPGVEISDVSATDGVLLVQVPGDGFTDRPDGMSKQAAELALQQLVYTLQGVQQDRVPLADRARGGPAQLFGLKTEPQFTDAPQLFVSSLVNITTPEQGAMRHRRHPVGEWSGRRRSRPT